MKQFLCKYKWTIIVVLGILAVMYPFILLFVERILNITIEFLLPFNILLKDSISSWITLCGVVAGIIGVYQIKISQDKQLYDLQNQKESLELQKMQFEFHIRQSIDKRYLFYLQNITSEDDSLKLRSIEELYILAQEYPQEYRLKVCNEFCSLIRNTRINYQVDTKMNKKSPEYVQRILTLLFMKSNVFYDCYKNLNNCYLVGISIIDSKINNTSLNNSILIDCSFHNSQIVGSNFIEINIVSSLFKTCSFKNLNLHKSRIDKTIFNKDKFINSIFTGIKFNESIFSSCRILNSDYSNSLFVGCMIYSSKFGEKNIFEDCDFNNVKLNFSEVHYKDLFLNSLPDKLKSVAIQEGNNIVFY